MIRKYLLPILAFVGATFAIYSVAQGSRPVPVALPVADPAQAPFGSYIAGAGLVEASSQNIAIGSPVGRLVLEVFVKPGDEVEQFAPLFRVDDRDYRAELRVRQSTLVSAKARLDRLIAMPRPEEIPPVEARVLEAETAVADLQSQIERLESVTDKRAVSADDLARRQFALRVAKDRVASAKADLTLKKVGAWKPDIDVAKAEVQAAEAQIHATETEISRLTILAPVKGTALQVNLRVGESAQAGLILFGSTSPLHVRVDIDENDAWRFKNTTSAVAFVRGNRDLKATLKFVRVEPFVVPKKSLTGESTERVDTRVMQVLYSFDRGELPVYVGQQMDVFIEAPSRGGKP